MKKTPKCLEEVLLRSYRDTRIRHKRLLSGGHCAMDSNKEVELMSLVGLVRKVEGRRLIQILLEVWGFVEV